MPLLRVVIALKLLLDVLKDLKHKLSFVEVKSLQQDDHQLDEAIDEPVIQGVVIGASSAFTSVQSEVDAVLDHHMSERVQHFFVLVDAEGAEVAEVVVHLFFLSSRVVNV